MDMRDKVTLILDWVETSARASPSPLAKAGALRYFYNPLSFGNAVFMGEGTGTFVGSGRE